MLTVLVMDGDASPLSTDLSKFMYDDRPKFVEQCPVLYHPKISLV